VFHALSPRRRLRVDADRRHDYLSAPYPPVAPAGDGEPVAEVVTSSTGRRRVTSWRGPLPYAVYLADRTGRYRLVCLDLDASAGPDVVAEDLARVCELLHDAGARYVVARSGPGGGRHVWLSIPDGAEAGQVAAMARGLAALLPSLDHGMLLNPAAGCARPIGAPHRRGGTSRLDERHHADPAAAVEALQRGNPSTLPEMVLAVLPPAVRESAARPIEPGRQYRPVGTGDDGAPRLSGPRRALSPAVAGLVRSRPADGDYSAHLWRILTGAALARWTRADVAALADDPTAVGLEHLRSRHHRGVRHDRGQADADELLARQWARAVERAAELPPTDAAAAGDADDDPRVAAVSTAVDALMTAAKAPEMRWRWVLPGGEADEAALHAVCLLALSCCSTELALDVRRWSEMTGYAASTVAVAARRLSTADPFTGPAWLEVAEPAAGTRARVWRLLSPADEDQALTGTGDAESGVSVQLSGPDEPPVDEHTDPAGGPGIRPVDQVRTQGRSPRPPTRHPQGVGGLRDKWQSYLASYVAVTNHDAWHPRGGLGHQTARTYLALLDGADDLDQLAAATGYTRTVTRRHVQRLAEVGLAEITGGRIEPGRVHLDAVAARLGTAGAGAARRARHVADREIHAWWLAELEWRRAPKQSKARVPAGWRPTPGQRALPVAPAGPMSTYGRFPTVAAGRRRRADFAAARRVVVAQLAGTVAGLTASAAA
jgi:hypothetical protein